MVFLEHHLFKTKKLILMFIILLSIIKTAQATQKTKNKHQVTFQPSKALAQKQGFDIQKVKILSAHISTKMQEKYPNFLKYQREPSKAADPHHIMSIIKEREYESKFYSNYEGSELTIGLLFENPQDKGKEKEPWNSSVPTPAMVPLSPRGDEESKEPFSPLSSNSNCFLLSTMQLAQDDSAGKGSITPEQRPQSPKADKEKEKGAERDIFPNADNEGFIFLNSSSEEDREWKEELKNPKIPFGRFLAQAIFPNQEPHPEKADSSPFNHEILQSIPITNSIHESLFDLQGKSVKRDQDLLRSIDSEEWTKLSDIPQATFDYTWKTKIINPHKKQNGLIAFFLIHGTFVDDVEFGKDLKMKLSQDLMNLAKMYALEHDCAVKVITFKWSGILDEEKRKEAGLILTRYVTTDPECIEAKQLGAYSHSFGGSVLLWLSEHLRTYKRKVDFAFNVGTPICEIKEKKAVDTHDRVLEQVTPEEGFNIGNLYQFFSNGDVTQAAGSIHSSSNLWQGKIGIFERRVPFLITPKNNVINFHFQHEGNLCSHVNIKWFVAGAIPFILPIVHSKYLHAHDLNVATCENNKDHLPILTLRHRIFSTPDKSTQTKLINFSDNNAQKFFDFYHKPIGNDNPLSVKKLYREYIHSTLNQTNHT